MTELVRTIIEAKLAECRKAVRIARQSVATKDKEARQAHEELIRCEAQAAELHQFLDGAKGRKSA